MQCRCRGRTLTTDLTFSKLQLKQDFMMISSAHAVYLKRKFNGTIWVEAYFAGKSGACGSWKCFNLDWWVSVIRLQRANWSDPKTGTVRAWHCIQMARMLLFQHRKITTDVLDAVLNFLNSRLQAQFQLRMINICVKIRVFSFLLFKFSLQA